MCNMDFFLEYLVNYNFWELANHWIDCIDAGKDIDALYTCLDLLWQSSKLNNTDVFERITNFFKWL